MCWSPRQDTRGCPQEALPVLSPHTGIQDPSYARSPPKDVTQSPQPPHFMVLQVVDPCSYILKKYFLMRPSNYQLSKIQRRQHVNYPNYVLAKPQ